jgi:tRNA (cmo5U34)-methyltransferase
VSEIIFDSKKASHYEDLARKAVFGYDQLFTMALSIFSDKLSESANLLVVGCGTGMELTTFGNYMPKWRLTGVDPSEEMIKIAKAKINSHGLNERVKLHHGFTDTLPEEEQFDGASLLFVLRFSPSEGNILTLFKNIAKRLKSGATLIIVDQYGDPGSKQFQDMSKAWRNIMKLNGTSSELVRKIAAQSIEQYFITEIRLQKLLFEAGFEMINRFYNSFLLGGWVVHKK